MNQATALRKRNEAAVKYGPRSRVTNEREADLREIVHEGLRNEIARRNQREKEIADILSLIRTLFEIARTKLDEYEQYPLARDATRAQFAETVRKACGWIDELKRMKANG